MCTLSCIAVKNTVSKGMRRIMEQTPNTILMHFTCFHGQGDAGRDLRLIFHDTLLCHLSTLLFFQVPEILSDTHVIPISVFTALNTHTHTQSSYIPPL